MKLFERLDQLMREEWDLIIKNNSFFKTLMDGCTDRRLFGLYLCEVYNTVKHTPITQALVTQNLLPPSSENIQYMKFCLKHALEEVGHEQMALHDLKSIGAKVGNDTMPPALGTTDALAAYIYRVSTVGNPVQRLGYSYWAEGCYELFMPISMCAIQNMKLEARNLTFFVQHSEIDDGHEEDVKNIIKLVVKTPADEEAVAETLRMTVQLTGMMLEGVYRAYEDFLKGKRPEYNFLNTIEATK